MFAVTLYLRRVYYMHLTRGPVNAMHRYGLCRQKLAAYSSFGTRLASSAKTIKFLGICALLLVSPVRIPRLDETISHYSATAIFQLLL